ncbi:MAG: MBL fold metallo-hydrolase [Candidatus Thermoplasmatota archaeon]|jgi:phosphoribosyl 1,2-cyclic phosphodiesterase|nr:MBL fold metallo-hydrolase [Candidatus Thermoplasmatota archaeon]
MLITSLASGSSGNSSLICSGSTCIIIDMGISVRKTHAALQSKGIDPKKIAALFITHGHSDHASGVHSFKKAFQVPVYGTYETSDIYVEQRGGYGGYQEMGVELDNFIKEGEDTEIGDLTIEAVRISHDARHPVAYFIHNGNRKASVITDLGESNPLLEKRVSECNVILIEANHDPLMLEKGPYPDMLKRRIRGARGHLSNQQTAKILRRAVNEDTPVLLAHLSKVNNTPQLAIQAVHGALRESGLKTEKIRALAPYNDATEIRV